jgi:hypothetical protein
MTVQIEYIVEVDISGVTRGGQDLVVPFHQQCLPDHQEKKKLIIAIH